MQDVDQHKESRNSEENKKENKNVEYVVHNVEHKKKTPKSQLSANLMDTSNSDDEVSEVESFILDQEDVEDSEGNARFLLAESMQNADLRSVDPETQARLEALLEAAGLGQLSTSDGKTFADPEVLRRLTSSVSCALDEAAAALTRMRADQQGESTRTLAEACHEGDISAVRRLLDAGRSVHETSEEGESLLSLACSAGYYELAQVLLAMRANVEDRGIKGDCTPLMEAASGGYVDIVRLLIAHGADINAQSTAGNTPLHYAACGGYEDVVKELIDAKATVEEHNENGHTPLMEAASAGHVNVAKILLNAGAGINTHSNEFKESALTLACYKGHLEMVQFLLEAGADQEHKTDEMHTALMEASMDGHVEVARLLLDSGAQVNMPADSFESPLTLAACGGHVELANLLIERGANLEEVNDEGYTPLMEAAREGHEDMVTLLLAHGADINAQTDETQETALTLACCGGFLDVAGFLISSGADYELGCSTPLMESAQEGHLELVKFLVKAGVNVHGMTGTGDTALTYACENGHTDVADFLLQHKANLEHESEGGRTPLMKAARAGHLCTVQFLISKGADVNRSTTINDHTVLSLACAGGHLTVVQLLLAHGADPNHRLKDGSTMLIEASRGGHTSVVNLLLEYPNGIGVQEPIQDTQLTTSVELDPRVPMQGLNNVVPPPDPGHCVGVSTGLSSVTVSDGSSITVADGSGIRGMAGVVGSSGNAGSSLSCPPSLTATPTSHHPSQHASTTPQPGHGGGGVSNASAFSTSPFTASLQTGITKLPTHVNLNRTPEQIAAATNKKVYLDKIPIPPGKKTLQNLSVAAMGAEMAGVVEQTSKPRSGKVSSQGKSTENFLSKQQHLEEHASLLSADTTSAKEKKSAFAALAQQVHRDQLSSISPAKLNNNNNAMDTTATTEPLTVVIPGAMGASGTSQCDGLGNYDHLLAREEQQIILNRAALSAAAGVQKQYILKSVLDAQDQPPASFNAMHHSPVSSPGLPPSPASVSSTSPCDRIHSGDSSSGSSTASSSSESSSADTSSGGSGSCSSNSSTTSGSDSSCDEGMMPDDQEITSEQISGYCSRSNTPVSCSNQASGHKNGSCDPQYQAETDGCHPDVLTSPSAQYASTSISTTTNSALFSADLRSSHDRLQESTVNWSKSLLQRPPADGAEVQESPASPTPPDTMTPPNSPPCEPLEIPITAAVAYPLVTDGTTLQSTLSTAAGDVHLTEVSPTAMMEAGLDPTQMVTVQHGGTTQIAQSILLPANIDLSHLGAAQQVLAVPSGVTGHLANLSPEDNLHLQQLYVMRNQQPVLSTTAGVHLVGDPGAVLGGVGTAAAVGSLVVTTTATSIAVSSDVTSAQSVDTPAFSVEELDVQHLQLQQQKHQLQTQLAIQKQIQVELQQQLCAQTYTLQQEDQLTDSPQQASIQPLTLTDNMLQHALQHQQVITLQDRGGSGAAAGSADSGTGMNATAVNTAVYQPATVSVPLASVTSSGDQQQLPLTQQIKLPQHIQLPVAAGAAGTATAQLQLTAATVTGGVGAGSVAVSVGEQQLAAAQAAALPLVISATQPPVSATTSALGGASGIATPTPINVPIVLPTAVTHTQHTLTAAAVLQQQQLHQHIHIPASAVTATFTGEQMCNHSSAVLQQPVATNVTTATAAVATATLLPAQYQQLPVNVVPTVNNAAATPAAGSIVNGTTLPQQQQQAISGKKTKRKLCNANVPADQFELLEEQHLHQQHTQLQQQIQQAQAHLQQQVVNSAVSDDVTAKTMDINGAPTNGDPSQTSPPVYANAELLDAQTESNHDTALTMACVGGHVELVRLLLTRGANIEHRDKKGFTPLILAATAGHKDVVEILLEHKADIEAQSERTKDTPLSLACSGGRVDVVSLLLEYDANKEHRNVSDYTPLSLAASGGYINIIKLLLGHGAEINSRTGSKLGISPLMLAAMNGHANAVKLLLDMGSDINAQIETNRNTALTLACFQGRNEVVSLLVERKANIEHRAKTGLTPLMEAASGGYVDVGRVLLNKGADVNAPPVPSSRDTALTIAADKGHYRFVELLLSSGATVDCKNKKGNSPLWLACNGGHLDVVQLLVNSGADIDSHDNRKVSCLMAAFRKGHIKVVRWMVKHVAQYPSDPECRRYISSATDKELVKKCQQCMDIIVTAKEKQAEEAKKNADILLTEIEQERSKEQIKKAAAARKRERKKQKRKEKAEKDNKEKEESGKNSSPEPESTGRGENSEEERVEEMREDVISEHLSTVPNTVANNKHNAKKNNEKSSATNAKNKLTTRPPAERILTNHLDTSKQNASFPALSTTATSNATGAPPPVSTGIVKSKNKRNRRDRTSSATSTNNSAAGASPVAAASIKSVRPIDHLQQQKHAGIAENNSNNTPSISVTTSISAEVIPENKVMMSPASQTLHGSNKENVHLSATPTSNKKRKAEEHQGNNDATPHNKQHRERKSQKSPGMSDKNVNKMNTSELLMPQKGIAKSPHAAAGPKRGHQRKEEGWKEVTRKPVTTIRPKKVVVNSSAISRVIGRGGCNINTIRDVSGAHIEVDKQKACNDRTVTIRGTQEAVQMAHKLISNLSKDENKDLDQLLAKLKIKKSTAVSATPTTATSVTVTSAVTSNETTTTVSVHHQPTSSSVVSCNVWDNSMASGIPVDKPKSAGKNKSGSQNPQRGSSFALVNGAPPPSTSVAWGGMGLPRQTAPRPQMAMPGQAGTTTTNAVTSHHVTASSISAPTTAVSSTPRSSSPTTQGRSPAVVRQLFPDGKPHNRGAANTTLTFTTQSRASSDEMASNASTSAGKNSDSIIAPISSCVEQQQQKIPTQQTRNGSIGAISITEAVKGDLAPLPIKPTTTAAPSTSKPVSVGSNLLLGSAPSVQHATTRAAATEYSPFSQHVFSMSAEQVLSKKDEHESDRMDFASVAAVGVTSLATTIASVTTSSGTVPIMSDKTESQESMADPAMAPGYKAPGAQRTLSPSSHLIQEQDQVHKTFTSMPPGVIGGATHGPGIMVDGPHLRPVPHQSTAKTMPLSYNGEKSYKDSVPDHRVTDNVASMLSQMTLAEQQQNLQHSPIIYKNIASPNQLQSTVSSTMSPNDTQRQIVQAGNVGNVQHHGDNLVASSYKSMSPPQAQLMAAPITPRSAPPTPRLGQQPSRVDSRQDQLDMMQAHHLHHSYVKPSDLHHQQAMRDFHAAMLPGSSLSPAPGSHEYSTPNKPMTLPKIESTLNPNAPDFTCSIALSNAAGYPILFDRISGAHEFNKAPGSQQMTMKSQMMRGAIGGSRDATNLVPGSPHVSHMMNRDAAPPGANIPPVGVNPAMRNANQPLAGAPAGSTLNPHYQHPITRPGNNVNLNVQRHDDNSLMSSLTHDKPSASPGAGGTQSTTAMHMGDDRKYPRPIGNERAQKKPAFESAADHDSYPWNFSDAPGGWPMNDTRMPDYQQMTLGQQYSLNVDSQPDMIHNPALAQGNLYKPGSGNGGTPVAGPLGGAPAAAVGVGPVVDGLAGGAGGTSNTPAGPPTNVYNTNDASRTPWNSRMPEQVDKLWNNWNPAS